MSQVGSQLAVAIRDLASHELCGQNFVCRGIDSQCIATLRRKPFKSLRFKNAGCRAGRGAPANREQALRTQRRVASPSVALQKPGPQFCDACSLSACGGWSTAARQLIHSVLGKAALSADEVTSFVANVTCSSNQEPKV